MKKIIALLLVSLMVFSVLPVMAEGNCEITLTKQNETAEGFDVLFSIKNNPTMAAMTLRIDYDKDLLTPVSLEKKGIFENQTVTTNIGNATNEINEVRVVWYKTSGLSENGDMFVVSFKFKEVSEAKQATIKIRDYKLDVVDKDANKIEYITNAVTVDVPKTESVTENENNTTEDNGNSYVPVGPSKPTVTVDTVTLKNKANVSKIKYFPIYENNTFAPDNDATRYEVIEALYNLVDITATKYEEAFKDVESKYEKSVKAFITAEILDGYEDKTFKGNNTITRAELVKVLTLTFKLEEDKNATAEFTDISGHWAESYIKTFVSKKYTYGYEDNTFRPENNVTRAEVAAFVNRIINAEGTPSTNVPTDLDASHWAYNDILKAIK